MSPYFQQRRAKIGHDLRLLPSVAAAIRDSDGRLLLQEKASGQGWSLPVGAIEPGESPTKRSSASGLPDVLYQWE